VWSKTGSEGRAVSSGRIGNPVGFRRGTVGMAASAVRIGWLMVEWMGYG
jgi:hypothetical protein